MYTAKVFFYCDQAIYIPTPTLDRLKLLSVLFVKEYILFNVSFANCDFPSFL